MSDPEIPKLKRDWVGRYVRLRHQKQTAGGEIFEAGEVMRVYRNYGGLWLEALFECTECARRVRGRIKKVQEYDVELIPPGFTPATVPTRRELIAHMGELSGYIHHLLEEGKLYGPEGYMFPDGAHFERLCRLVNTVLPAWRAARQWAG